MHSCNWVKCTFTVKANVGSVNNVYCISHTADILSVSFFVVFGQTAGSRSAVHAVGDYTGVYIYSGL